MRFNIDVCCIDAVASTRSRKLFSSPHFRSKIDRSMIKFHEKPSLLLFFPPRISVRKRKPIHPIFSPIEKKFFNKRVIIITLIFLSPFFFDVKIHVNRSTDSCNFIKAPTTFRIHRNCATLKPIRVSGYVEIRCSNKVRDSQL